MISVAYSFHVQPRHHAHFCHAWQAAQDTFKGFIGLLNCQLLTPRAAREPFTLVFNWTTRPAFERFTRTWIGVWAINGLGLEQGDFFAPTQTAISE
jgi:heme-degrading monooxygenase HmoA